MMSSFLTVLGATESTDSNVPLLVFVTALYVLVIGYLGFRGFKQTKTSTDYLLAGRNIHPYVMALSYGATFISTSAIIGFGGIAALFGMSLLWLTFLNIFVGIFIAFVFFGKRTRQIGHRLNAHTFPELLGRRYQSKFIQVFIAAVIFVMMPLYAAAVLRGGAEFIKETFHIELSIAIFIFALIIAAYVVAGGLKGVMFTDAAQGSIMFIGMFALLAITYYELGGITAAHQALTDLYTEVAPAGEPVGGQERMMASFMSKGHQGWTSMPAFPSPYWYIVVTSIVMGVGIGVLAQPQLVVRFMTVRSGRELNRAILVGGIFIFMMTGVAFLVGPLSNVYFHKTEGKIAMVATIEPVYETNEAGELVPVMETKEDGTVAQKTTPPNADAIMPKFINKAMPKWFVVILLLTLLSAAMSTISSQFHTMGTSVGRDIWEQGMNKKGDESRSIQVTRIGIIIAFCVTLGLSLVMPVSIIARATAVFFGTCAAAFLPMYIGGLYWSRINRPGAIAGMLTGFSVALILLLFVNQSNASQVGLCQFIFGKPFLGTYPWIVIDPMIFALPASTIVTIVVSLVTAPMPEAMVKKTFAKGKLATVR